MTMIEIPDSQISDAYNRGFALQLSAAQQQAVNCGTFWPPQVNLGPFIWECWIMPMDNQGVIIVDGFGGSHSINFETLQTVPGAKVFFQGFVTGVGSIQTFDGLWPNEPGHAAFGWDGNNPGFLYMWVNGLLSAKSATTGARQSPSQVAGGGGQLAIGSLGHAGGNFVIQQVRGFDGLAISPVALPIGRQLNGELVQSGYTPESIFSPETSIANFNGLYSSSFCMSFREPASQPRDLSNGCFGQQHHGVLGSLATVQNAIGGGVPNIYPRPNYVPDPGFPSGLVINARTQPIIKPPTPQAIPGGAKVFDDFSQGWQTQAWDNVTPQLPKTKGGSLGTLSWTCVGTRGSGAGNPVGWGTDNASNAVCLYTANGGADAVAFVDVGSTTQDVRVSRVGPVNPNGLNGEVGLVFRLNDFQNFMYLQAIYDAFAGGAMHLWCFKVVNGVDVAPSGGAIDIATPNDTWTILRVTVSGTNITAFVDNGAGGFTQVATTTENIFTTGTKCGLLQYDAGGTTLAGPSTRRRFTNFTVF